MAPALGLPVATAIAAAMRRVASAGADPPTTIDRDLLDAAWTHLLGRSEPLDQDAIPPLTTEELAAAVPDRGARELALRFVVAAALHEARLVSRRLAVAREIAAAWSFTVAQFEQLAVTVEARLDEVIADVMRPDRPSFGAPFDAAQPTAALRQYANGHADPALVARYRALAARPPRTFGRAFHDLYLANRFRFPGEAGALHEAAAVPHDATHVLTSYATTAQDELLVATFIAAMRGDDDVTGFALTALYLWHLGLHFGAQAGGDHGWLEPAKFSLAWERGRATRVDLFGPQFVFWDNLDRYVDDVRRWAGVGPPQRRGPAEGPGIIGPRPSPLQ
jgi:hypothetical protein